MNRKDFLKELKAEITKLPQDDQDEILYDYDEHFTNGLTEGRTEELIAESLGDPKIIAKQYNTYYLVQKAEKYTSINNVARAVLATASVSFLNLLIIIGPLLLLTVLLVVLFIFSGIIAAAGATLVIEGLAGPVLPEYLRLYTNPSVQPLAIIFLGIGLFAAGVLFLIGNLGLVKLFFTGIVKYLKMNLKIIKGVK